MARYRDLTIRAALETAGVTRGVDRLVRDMQRLQREAEQNFGGNLVPDLSQAGVTAGREASEGIAQGIKNDQERVSQAFRDSVGNGVSEAVTEAAGAIQKLDAALNGKGPQLGLWDQYSGEIQRAADSVEALAASGVKLDPTISAMPAFAAATELAAASQAEIARDIGLATGAYKRGEISLKDYSTAIQIAREQATALRVAGGGALAREISKAEIAIVLASEATDDFAKSLRKLKAEGALSGGSISGGALDIHNARNAKELARDVENVNNTSRRASVGMGRLNNSLVVFARQSAGAHPIVGQLIDVVGTFAIGTALMVPVLAGLSALAVAWDKITEASREAAKEQEEAMQRLQRLQEQYELDQLGPGGQSRADLERANVRLAEIQTELAAAYRTAKQDAVTLTTAGLTPEGVQSDITELEGELARVAQLTIRARETISAAEQTDADRREREAQQELQRIRQLTAARRQMGDILREAAVTGPIGVFDIGDLPTKLQEAFRNAEDLRGRIRSVEAAIESLQDAGGEAPGGAYALLASLTEEAGRADQKVSDLANNLQRAIERFDTTEIVPTIVDDYRFEIPAIVDPYSLEALERSLELARGRIALDFARGIIDADEFEREGREAADRFNAALIQRIQRLAANGDLSAALELATNLIIDVEVPEDNAFNDAIEGVRNVTSGFRDLAGALGDTSEELSSSLSALDSFINGIVQIQEGRKESGLLGTLSQVSGVLSIAAGVFTLIQGLTRDAQRPTESDRIVEENSQALRDLALELAGFRVTPNILQEALIAARGVAEQTATGGRGSIASRFAGDAASDRRVLSELLEPFGLTVDEFAAVAEEAGVRIFDSTGNIVVPAFQDLADAIGLTIRTLTGFENSLSGIQQERELGDRLRGIERTPEQELSAFLGDLQELAPQLFDQFLGGIDLGDTGAIRQAIIAMFEAFSISGNEDFAALMGDLSREDLIKYFGQVADSLNAMDDVVNDLTSSMRGVPQGFRILNLDLVRFNAAQAETAETLRPRDPDPAPDVPKPSGGFDPDREGPTDTGRGGRMPVDGPVFNIEDNRVYRFELAQQPGESAEDFARRVEAIVRSMDRQDTLVMGA